MTVFPSGPGGFPAENDGLFRVDVLKFEWSFSPEGPWSQGSSGSGLANPRRRRSPRGKKDSLGATTNSSEFHFLSPHLTIYIIILQLIAHE